MRPNLPITAFALSLFFSGCGLPLPDSQSEVRAVYSRMGQNSKRSEAIIVVHSEFAWRAFSPEPSPAYGYKAETKYYFSDRHVRRKPLRFLEPLNTGWEIIVPIEGTNCWLRVQGSRRFNRPTNELGFTLFSPQKVIYRQTIQTTDMPTTNYLHFTDGNCVLRYKSEHDAFSYSVLENELTRDSAEKNHPKLNACSHHDFLAREGVKG